MCERSVTRKLRLIKPPHYFSAFRHVYTRSRPSVHVCRKSGMEYVMREKELRDLCDVCFFYCAVKKEMVDACGFH
jgi:hypothetical protein